MENATLLESIRAIAEGYVKEYLPDEFPYFDLVWGQVQHPLAGPTATLSDDKTSWLECLVPASLGFENTQGVSILTPAVILTLEAVAIETSRTLAAPTVQQIQRALTDCAKAFDLADEVAIQLGQHMAVKLHAHVVSVLSGTPVAPSPPFKPLTPEEKKEWVNLLGTYGDQFSTVSPAMFAVLKIVDRVAKSVAAMKNGAAGRLPTMLVYGETGTGKEFLAEQIHRLIPREKAPFIAVNCAALPETLLESELFGHEKGAFTGAIAQRKGQFELADGGTIFLDEIGNMPLLAQTRLLRVLEKREFQRIGGKDIVHVDVRVIAATNKRLEDLIAKRQFLMELFYRLDVCRICLPALRDRIEDIPLLANHFLESSRNNYDGNKKGLAREAIELLKSHAWPGNIRELKNVLENAYFFSKSDVITADDVAAALKDKRVSGVQISGVRVPNPVSPLIRKKLQELIPILQRIEEKADGRMEKACATLQKTYADQGLDIKVPKSTAHGWLTKAGLAPKDVRYLGPNQNQP